MTDKELLELAAKAAGMELVKWTDKKDGLWAYIKSGGYGFVLWNPLSDDGDALRLAVKLGLRLEFYMRQVDVEDASEVYGDDHYSATRRAIVRAAAEIERTL